MRFFTKTVLGAWQFVEAITSFTGTANQIPQTNADGFIDPSLIDVSSLPLSWNWVFSNEGNLNSDRYLLSFEAIFSDRAPYKAQYDSTIKRAVVSQRKGDTTGSFDAEIRVNTVTVLTISKTAGTDTVYTGDIDILLNQADEVSVFISNRSGQNRDLNIELLIVQR